MRYCEERHVVLCALINLTCIATFHRDPTPWVRLHLVMWGQTCRWKFFAFSGTFRVHLGVREDSLRGTLLFSLVQSNFMRDFEGQWTVRPTEARMLAKTGTEEWCEVEHQLSVVPSVPVPLPLSYYTRSIFVRQVEGILADLQRAILATVAAEQTAEPTSVAALAASVMERARRI